MARNIQHVSSDYYHHNNDSNLNKNELSQLESSLQQMEFTNSRLMEENTRLQNQLDTLEETLCKYQIQLDHQTYAASSAAVELRSIRVEAEELRLSNSTEIKQRCAAEKYQTQLEQQIRGYEKLLEETREQLEKSERRCEVRISKS